MAPENEPKCRRNLSKSTPGAPRDPKGRPAAPGNHSRDIFSNLIWCWIPLGHYVDHVSTMFEEFRTNFKHFRTCSILFEKQKNEKKGPTGPKGPEKGPIRNQTTSRPLPEELSNGTKSKETHFLQSGDLKPYNCY